MLSLENILEEKSKQSSVQGEWHTIQWTPDPALQERLNIGVAAKDKSGEICVKFLDSFERIKCLYSTEMVFHAELACNVAREYILSTNSLGLAISPSITINNNGFFQGESLGSCVDNLFDSVVTLSRPFEKKSARKFKTIDRDSLFNNMKDKLKVSLGYSYSDYCPENPFQNVSFGNQQRSLFLPFRKSGSVATLASTVYADHKRIKCNLYDAHRDIETAGKSTSKEPAIFYLLSDTSQNETKQNQINEVIDTFSWYMKNKNIYIGAHVSQDDLAGDIAEWCLHSAA